MYSVFQDRFVYMCAPSSRSARHFGAHSNVWRCQIMAVRGSVQSRLAAGPRKEYGLNITFGQKRLYIASVRRKIPRSKHYICPTRRCKIINSRWSQSLSHLLWLNGRDQMPHRKHYPSTDLDFELHISRFWIFTETLSQHDIWMIVWYLQLLKSLFEWGWPCQGLILWIWQFTKKLLNPWKYCKDRLKIMHQMLWL